MLQPNVLDVQGQAVQGALKHLGFESVSKFVSADELK